MFEEKYLKYKKKYKELKLTQSNKQVGGARINNFLPPDVTMRTIVIQTENDIIYYFYVINYTDGRDLHYRPGSIVFVRANTDRYLMSIVDFLNDSQFGSDLCVAFRQFLSDYSAIYGRPFYELFFPCTSRNGDPDCLAEEDPMYFILFESEYRRPCNVANPWSTITDIMLTPGGGWNIMPAYEHASLNDINQTTTNTIISDDGSSILLYIEDFGQYSAQRNNICNLPVFINSIPANHQTEYNIGYLTGTNWLSLCCARYTDCLYDFGSAFGYFRGQQIPWMHFKLKGKAEFEYIFENFFRID